MSVVCYYLLTISCKPSGSFLPKFFCWAVLVGAGKHDSPAEGPGYHIASSIQRPLLPIFISLLSATARLPPPPSPSATARLPPTATPHDGLLLFLFLHLGSSFRPPPDRHRRPQRRRQGHPLQVTLRAAPGLLCALHLPHDAQPAPRRAGRRRLLLRH